MSSNPIKLHKINSPELISLLNVIEKKVFDLLDFKELYDIDLKKARLEATLFLLSIKIYQEREDENFISTFNAIVDEIPKAISKKIIHELQEENININDFVNQRLNYYGREYKSLVQSSVIEDVGAEVINISYRILAEPLIDELSIHYDDLLEFGSFLDNYGYINDFFNRIINISNYIKSESKQENINSFEMKVDKYMTEYVLEFGQRKFQDVAKHLLTSKSFKNFLEKSRIYNVIPKVDDIIATIMNILYFGFGKKTTVRIGIIMLLQTWNEEINKDKRLINDFDLCVLLDETLKKSLK